MYIAYTYIYKNPLTFKYIYSPWNNKDGFWGTFFFFSGISQHVKG